ncbi:dihydrolipoamide acetyltransferase family protein [Tuberibacillus sp. Marseille-P3662]|uniref:dihydrolipoamide acetyltransferase family protein n=1 Tax=Tuberibacillus sp. Marseille-P3662 TaxID=1965358 RepID=UPI000A1C94EC|nr:dihydrolipoamide acetyltransferase family protein [Tuberibacillus sp. Marseille-P3662]
MAKEKVLMPQLGESVTEGTISQWLISPGDHVNKYDPIAEVTTDKVNAEVPISLTGEIVELVAGEGDTIEVGELIAYLETEEKASNDDVGKNNAQSVADTHTTPDHSSESSMKKRYSPAVLRLSQEHDIDLNQVEGSGKGGRITRKDLEKLIASDHSSPANNGANPEPQPTPQPKQPAQSQDRSVDIPIGEGDREVPVTGVRKAIADNMVKSKHEAPHAWTMIEVDVTNLVNYRGQIKDEFKSKEGYSLTFLPFFIKSVVEALREYPRVNAMWSGDKIIEKKDVNISMAVSTDDALYVPVIKQADEKSIKGLAHSVHDLAGKVRRQQLSADDMQGGTFTVNNTGSFGSVLSQPIINYPQAAILSVESIVKRPIVMDNNMIAVRDMVNLCLSLDHRILDGLIAGRFLQSVKNKLENITEDNTSIY